jgi:hypothetical protein
MEHYELHDKRKIVECAKISLPITKHLKVWIFRYLGFPLGAKLAVGNSHFGHGSGIILIDELVKDSERPKCDGQKQHWQNECISVPYKRTD